MSQTPRTTALLVLFPMATDRVQGLSSLAGMIKPLGGIATMTFFELDTNL